MADRAEMRFQLLTRPTVTISLHAILTRRVNPELVTRALVQLETLIPNTSPRDAPEVGAMQRMAAR